MQVLLLLLFLFSALLLWGENFPSFPFTLCLCANILVLEACLCLTTSLASIQTSVKGVTNLKEMQIKWISHCQNARCYKGKETSLSRKITKGKSRTISHSYPSTLCSDWKGNVLLLSRKDSRLKIRSEMLINLFTIKVGFECFLNQCQKSHRNLIKAPVAFYKDNLQIPPPRYVLKKAEGMGKAAWRKTSSGFGLLGKTNDFISYKQQVSLC